MYQMAATMIDKPRWIILLTCALLFTQTSKNSTSRNTILLSRDTHDFSQNRSVMLNPRGLMDVIGKATSRTSQATFNTASMRKMSFSNSPSVMLSQAPG